MFEMAKHSMVLFFRGKLFKDSAKAYRKIMGCTIFTAIILIVIFLFMNSIGLADKAIWIASAIAGFAGGLMQPYFFRDLKYA
ncbi:MAG TPA: hypothetical protein VKA94_12390 [Hyphomicrobiales bacterium]|nr:hypothetical protein [Hyphomicrobiales bacterium]